MKRLILRRLAISVPLLVVVSLMTFVLVSLTPGDAAYTVLGAGAPPEQLAQLREEMGLDSSVLSQYFSWLGNAVHGDLGNSLITGESVTRALGQHVVPTLALAILSLLVSGGLGVLIGVWSAARGGRLAKFVDSASFVGLAVPGFLLGILLIWIFSLKVELFPASGYVSLVDSPVDWLKSLVLPVVAMSFGGIGLIAKQTRAAMEDVLGREFVVVLRANGFNRRSIVWKHGLKTAAVQIQSVIGVYFVSLLSGAVLVESVFAIPGLGSMAVQASGQSDITTLLGVTVMFTLLVVVANLVLDIAFLAVNPKVVYR